MGIARGDAASGFGTMQRISENLGVRVGENPGAELLPRSLCSSHTAGAANVVF